MNSTTCKCTCDPLIYPEYIAGCHFDNDTEPIIERYANSWIGRSIDSKTNTTVYTVALNCFFCTGETGININTQEGLTSQGQNGTSCTDCATNYSVALSGKRCVQCPTYWPLLFIFIILGALVADVGLVFNCLESYSGCWDDKWIHLLCKHY